MFEVFDCLCMLLEWLIVFIIVVIVLGVKMVKVDGLVICDEVIVFCEVFYICFEDEVGVVWVFNLVC